ncbi:MAG: ABC transporter permease, partial [Rubrivivax sp.]|nr:ABC transporter permease [Rubrivivax sp.]
MSPAFPMPMPKFVLLWTDAAIWLLLLVVLAYALSVLRKPELADKWGRVFRNAPALASSIILLLCLGVTLLDSVHFRPLLPPA